MCPFSYLYNARIYAGTKSDPGMDQRGLVYASVWNCLQNPLGGCGSYLDQGHILVSGIVAETEADRSDSHGSFTFHLLDNWYTSPPLTRDLAQRNTYTRGTTRRSRKHLPDGMPGKKDLERGQAEFFHLRDQSVVVWNDNRPVIVNYSLPG